MITILTGNIFTTNCTTIVNTVNCVGVMGAGIAYECRLRYPEMYEKYQTLCKNNLLQIGTLWIYKASNKNILNFPTKIDWKQPSKIEYLEKGLEKFVDTYKEKEITSIAFPLLGASHGGMTQEQSLSTMKRYLSSCDIDIEIWHFDPSVTDDIFLNYKQYFLSRTNKELSKSTGISINIITKIKDALNDTTINSMSSLLNVKGIGDRTLEKSFKFITTYDSLNDKTLFD
ncbi:macro domain-containing protein [Pedobacter agri]|uniref:macro domain-containing protein n=1 Tax=Pedobacter agri TaxID=454586 RepID=UPI0027879FF9|nr:macro domain-containing protein [Pedobacter agri]MDQ1139522.1 O-acetyl-ADP-ribose deacetylase (regulator of RNase III) [Pedobacter agri]